MAGVADMMNGVLFHSDKSENLIYLTRLLLDNNADAIIVRERGVPVGIVTSKDVLNGLLKMKQDPENIKAADVMSSPIVAIEHDQAVHEARELMLSHGIKKIPVRKDYDVVGLLVQTDIIRDLSWYTGLE